MYIDNVNRESLNYNLKIVPIVNAICEPLFTTFGITHFGYIKILSDGSMLRIANNAEWTQRYFEKSFYNDLDIYTMEKIPLNSYKSFLLFGEPVTAHQRMLCVDYNIWNCLAIVERFEDYGNFWFFGSTRENTEILHTYINDIDFFKHFTSYFKDKAHEFMEIKDRSRLIRSTITPLSMPFKEKNHLSTFMENTQVMKYYLEGKHKDTYFSKREIESMSYFSKGNTVKEVAKSMSLSPRTVEGYINNVKVKTGCNNKSELIKLFKNQLIHTNNFGS